MPLLEAEILGRAASPSIHLMGLMDSLFIQTGKATHWHRLGGRNVGNKYLNGTLGFPVGSEKQEGLLPVGEGQLGWDWTGEEPSTSGAQAWSLNSFGNFLLCLKSEPWLGTLELFNRNHPGASPSPR